MTFGKMILTKAVIVGVTLTLLSCDSRVLQPRTTLAFKINYNVQPLENPEDYQKLLKTLDGFLKTKNQSPTENPFWLPSDFEKYGRPYDPIMFIEENDKIADTNYFKPTLLNIVRTDNEDELVLKLAFIGRDSTGLSDLRAIYNIVAIRKDNDYRFKSIFDQNLARLHTKTVGTITYVYKDTLDIDLARRMDEYSKDFARKFDVDPIPITYYKCKDPVELFRLKGFDYTPSMYIDTTGGRGEPWHNALFAANNSEWYPREIIGFYLVKAFGGDVNFIIREGYQTYLGGTAGKSLDNVLKTTSIFYQAHLERDILKDLRESYRIHGNLYLAYPVGGLIIRITNERLGFEGIKRLFHLGRGEDGFSKAVDSVLGVKGEELSSYLRREITKY